MQRTKARTTPFIPLDLKFRCVVTHNGAFIFFADTNIGEGNPRFVFGFGARADSYRLRAEKSLNKTGSQAGYFPAKGER